MNNVIVLIFITVVIVALAIMLLGVQTFFSRRKKFPHTHVGGNKEMAKRGVFCVQTQDAMERKGVRPHRQGKHIEEEIVENNDK